MEPSTVSLTRGNNRAVTLVEQVRKFFQFYQVNDHCSLFCASASRSGAGMSLKSGSVKTDIR